MFVHRVRRAMPHAGKLGQKVQRGEGGGGFYLQLSRIRCTAMPMRLRSPLAALAALLLASAVIPAPARADDPDMNDLMGALDEASAALDIAWLGTLVDHGQFDAAVAAQSAAFASADRLKGEQ